MEPAVPDAVEEEDSPPASEVLVSLEEDESEGCGSPAQEEGPPSPFEMEGSGSEGEEEGAPPTFESEGSGCEEPVSKVYSAHTRLLSY